MAELDPTPVTVSTDSDLALAERPSQSDRRDVSLMDKLLIKLFVGEAVPFGDRGIVYHDAPL